MAQTNGASKTMSSRLMNMKFMQRAQSKESLKSPSQKDSDGRPNKRQRTREPATPSGADSDTSFLPTPTSVDLAREKLLADQAELAGDTKWTLDRPEFEVPAMPNGGLRVRTAGYGIIDNDHDSQVSSDEEAGRDKTNVVRSGRRAFGPPSKEVEPKKDASSEITSSSQRDSDSEESGSSDEQYKTPVSLKAAGPKSRSKKVPRDHFDRDMQKSPGRKMQSRKAPDLHEPRYDLGGLKGISGPTGGNKRTPMQAFSRNDRQADQKASKRRY